MGKKLDALLGRAFKPSRFKSHASLAISRIAVFKNQRRVRCNQARSDVVQLLELGQLDRALLRVEQVIKEQNMLDVFVMLEGYCNLVIERIHLIEEERVCPDELKEAISGLLFASSRCGDFPELQEIRAIFTSRYGKEFAARAIELRNNCGVNTKIIQKLSTRQPDMQSRRNALKEIADENGIALPVGETSGSSEEILDISRKQSQPLETSAIEGAVSGDVDEFSDSMKTKKKYRDVADAAQAAFESAAYAAAAARAAVELSRSDSYDPDDQNSPSTERKRVSNSSKDKETHHVSQAEELNQDKRTQEIKTSSPSSSDGSVEGNLDLRAMSFNVVDPVKLLEKEVVIHDSDDDNYDSDGSSSDMKTRKLKDNVLYTKPDDERSEKAGLKFQCSSNKQIPSNLRADLKVETGPEIPIERVAESSGTGMKGKQRFTINKEPISVRTRQVRGY